MVADCLPTVISHVDLAADHRVVGCLIRLVVSHLVTVILLSVEPPTVASLLYYALKHRYGVEGGNKLVASPVRCRLIWT